jgi:hypothetical protein
MSVGAQAEITTKRTRSAGDVAEAYPYPLAGRLSAFHPRLEGRCRVAFGSGHFRARRSADVIAKLSGRGPSMVLRDLVGGVYVGLDEIFSNTMTASRPDNAHQVGR